jgi:3-oxoacyl-[acyl-carrier-protein] synthase-1
VQRQAPAKAATTVQVIGLGFGQEKATVSSEEPLLGLGLAEAARAALAEAGLQLHDTDFRLSDATGEAYGFKEQALAVARLHRVWKAEFPHWHCADSIGDAGAAAGVCQLVIASQAFRRGYAFGDRAICFTSATSEDRAVAVLQRQVA